MPEPVVEAPLDILGRPSAEEQRVSPDTERILGRAPRTFADWAARDAAAFRVARGPDLVGPSLSSARWERT